jgi:small subunit ribosomal protein S20
MGFVTFVPSFPALIRRYELPARSSVEKRHAQSERSRLRNKSYKSMLKTRTKEFLETVGSGNKTSAQEEYRSLVGLLDKAVSKGILHKNTAARKKSRMSKVLNRV